MPTTYLVCCDSRDDRRLRRVFKTARDSGQQPRSVLACSASQTQQPHPTK